MWVCETQFPAPPITFAALSDQTGKFGLTRVVCHRISFGPNEGERPFADFRAWLKIAEIIGEL